jgi:enamine deaminase RidA (YjgF/YER057c/UK114 family)
MKQVFPCIILLLFLSSCNKTFKNSFVKEYIDAGPMYSKAIAVTNGNVKTIYVAGLTGDGVDFETQTRSTFENIGQTLEKAGASLKDIVKTTIYIPNYTEDNMIIFRRVRKEILGDNEMPASTAIGVSKLAAKNKLIEIEAIAVLQIKNK